MSTINLTEQLFIAARQENNRLGDDFKALYENINNQLTFKQFHRVNCITGSSLKYKDSLTAIKKVTKSKRLLDQVGRAEALLSQWIESGHRYRRLKDQWLMSA